MASLADARVAAASARFVHSGEHAMPPRWSPGCCVSQRAFCPKQTVLGAGVRARRNGRVQLPGAELEAAGRLESGAARTRCQWKKIRGPRGGVGVVDVDGMLDGEAGNSFGIVS